MKKILIVGAVAAISALGLTSLASSQPSIKSVKFTAALNVGQEVPHPKGTKVGAAGRFTATVTGTTLTWKLTYKNLSGATVGAHVHVGAKGKAGNVAVVLCPAACASGITGTATVTAEQVALMKKKGTYVNVHTSKNANGEIRGQIHVAM